MSTQTKVPEFEGGSGSKGEYPLVEVREKDVEDMIEEMLKFKPKWAHGVYMNRPTKQSKFDIDSHYMKESWSYVVPHIKNYREPYQTILQVLGDYLVESLMGVWRVKRVRKGKYVVIAKVEQVPVKALLPSIKFWLRRKGYGEKVE